MPDGGWRFTGLRFDEYQHINIGVVAPVLAVDGVDVKGMQKQLLVLQQHSRERY